MKSMRKFSMCLAAGLAISLLTCVILKGNSPETIVAVKILCAAGAVAAATSLLWHAEQVKTWLGK